MNSNSGKQSERESITIIGLGWGAVGFLKHINTNYYQVYLFSDRPYFTYTPLLPESIFNEKTLREIRIPVEKFLKPFCSFISGKLTDVCFDSKTLVVERSLPFQRQSIAHYDHLILSHGASVNTFGITGMETYALPLKTYDDVLRIRERFASDTHSNSKSKPVAVMGCGWTGAETIGALLDNGYKNIHAIDAMSRPLMSLQPKQSDFVSSIWENAGVNLSMNHKISGILKDRIQSHERNDIIYDFAIWCGGIKPSTLTRNIMSQINRPTMSRERGIAVDDYLHVLNRVNKPIPNVYAMGDCSSRISSPLPPTAQVAYQQGVYLAKEMNRRKEFESKEHEVFKWKDRGQLGYIGRGNSVYSGFGGFGNGKLIHYVNRLAHAYQSKVVLS